ncbi:hypothetical protein [Chitinophaga filiformis]|uniref:Uncharacterized protein n=1 Tax=Chitinophaga filiformis TaxID=104663 RepID=A0A1G7M2J7_CHIFI|nr:hypothetical protein [Chitinophaga filiformis]SDF55399.1 hypothetical protein SAMN04488121_102253 [Chitinophaga filiformis]
MTDRIESTLLHRFRQATAEGKALSDKYWRGEITPDEFFEQLRSDTSHELCELCAKSYCEQLAQQPEHDWIRLYFEDIKRAAGIDDLEMLFILDYIPAEMQLVVPIAIDEFLLSYYVGFFKNTTNKYEISISQMLFERVLDTSEPDLDIYTWVIDEIFSMGKDPGWFTEFHRGVEKLLLRAAVNQETLQAMKKGLTGTSMEIREDIVGIIAYTYENRREILVLAIQQDDGDTIALMQFQDGTKPETGMELNNGEVTCRIEDFVQSSEFGQLYNCLVTVTGGELTTDSCFEVQI